MTHAFLPPVDPDQRPAASGYQIVNRVSGQQLHIWPPTLPGGHALVLEFTVLGPGPTWLAPWMNVDVSRLSPQLLAETWKYFYSFRTRRAA